MGKQPEAVKNMQAFVGTRGMQTVPECLSSLVHVEGNKWESSVDWDPLIKKWKVDEHGWYDYLVVAHNGKCAARLMADSGAPLIHDLPSGLDLFSKLQLNYDGAFVDHPDISWIGNNTSKYRKNQLECWTVISTKAFGANHKVPQEFIPPSKKKEVTHLLLIGSAEMTGTDRKALTTCFTKVQLWGAANP